MPAPPPPLPPTDWTTLFIGFVLGLVGSSVGAFLQTIMTSRAGRRDHQFERMLGATDRIRDNIEKVVPLSCEYWEKEGSHADCARLASEIMGLHNKIVSELALVRKLDPKRFEKLEAECELDFMEALTGGQFQVLTRQSDATAGAHVRRFGTRLSGKIATCSASPSARRWFV